MPRMPSKLPDFEVERDAPDQEYVDQDGVLEMTGLPDAKIAQYFSKSGPGGYAIDTTHGSFKRLYSEAQVRTLVAHLNTILKVPARRLLLQKMINRLENASHTPVL